MEGKTTTKANRTSLSLERRETSLPAVFPTLETIHDYSQESSDEQHLRGRLLKIQGPVVCLHTGQMGAECGLTGVHHRISKDSE